MKCLSLKENKNSFKISLCFLSVRPDLLRFRQSKAMDTVLTLHVHDFTTKSQLVQQRICLYLHYWSVPPQSHKHTSSLQDLRKTSPCGCLFHSKRGAVTECIFLPSPFSRYSQVSPSCSQLVSNFKQASTNPSAELDIKAICNVTLYRQGSDPVGPLTFFGGFQFFFVLDYTCIIPYSSGRTSVQVPLHTVSSWSAASHTIL